MRWIDRARQALSDLFHRDRFEREMDEELRGFLDLAAEDRERHGTTSAEAYRTERARFGGVEACKDSLRDARAGATVESIARDVRFSTRSLLRHPGFSTAAILTIALGIFPLTAVVGLANGLFFHPAPGVTDADRLVRVQFLTRDATGDVDNARLSYGNHRDLAKGLSSLTGLAGRFAGSASIIAPGADGLHVDVDFVTHDYFRVLGMRMAAGRAFTPDEDRAPGGSPVAILGHRLASMLFDNADRAPGRTVLINGLNFTVVGVTPPEFRGLKNDHHSQVWIPGATSLRVWHTSQERWDERLGIGKNSSLVRAAGCCAEPQTAPR